MKSLVSIRGNKYDIVIAGNTFTYNSVVKGLIYIENVKEFS